jgi:hypothetical protein
MKTHSHSGHTALKSVGALFYSGVGWSAAYFLDPELGPARRRHAIDVLGHTRRQIARSKLMNVDPNAPKWSDYVLERPEEMQYSSYESYGVGIPAYR